MIKVVSYEGDVSSRWALQSLITYVYFSIYYNNNFCCNIEIFFWGVGGGVTCVTVYERCSLNLTLPTSILDTCIYKNENNKTVVLECPYYKLIKIGHLYSWTKQLYKMSKNSFDREQDDHL